MRTSCACSRRRRTGKVGLVPFAARRRGRRRGARAAGDARGRGLPPRDRRRDPRRASGGRRQRLHRPAAHDRRRRTGPGSRASACRQGGRWRRRVVEAGAGRARRVAVRQLLGGHARAGRAAACATATAFQLDPLALAAEPRLGARLPPRRWRRWGNGRCSSTRPRRPPKSRPRRRRSAPRAPRALSRKRFAALRGRSLRLACGRSSWPAARPPGAVVDALGVRALAIGPEIDPGVPWTRAVGGEPYRLALKSGNFGGRDFFAKATGDAAVSAAKLREALCVLAKSLVDRGLRARQLRQPLACAPTTAS